VSLTLFCTLTLVAQAGTPSNQEAADELKLGAWRVLGPMPAGAAQQPTSPGMIAKGMRAGVPWNALRASFAGPDGMLLPWTEPDIEGHLASQDVDTTNPRARVQLDSGHLRIADLLPLVRANPDYAKGSTAFLYLPVYANATNSIPVTCGGEGKITLWWNGKRMLSDKRPGRFNPTGYSLDLDVVPGLNHLLVEVTSNHHGWSFELQSVRRIANPRIHHAIDLGVQYLLDRQAIDGSWPAYTGYPNGVSALAVYTLVKSGVSPRHESVLKGLAHLRRYRAERTYSVALELMAYHAGQDPQDDLRIEELAEDLVGWQHANGMWGYGDDQGNWSGDLSNTQYAALGLRAAAAHGVEIPQSTWKDLAEATLDCMAQRVTSRVTTGRTYAPVGFGYMQGSGGQVSPSMTAAGIGTLAICRDNLDKQRNEKLLRRIDRGIGGGSAWLGENWTLGDGSASVWDFYYVYGLARAGGLADTETFGKHEWYWEGASHLVDLQRENGSWADEKQPLADCFALLFLRRATGKLAVTNVTAGNPFMIETKPEVGPLKMRLSLRPPLALWIDSTTEGFEDIVRVIYWLKPPVGDWVRVEEFQETRFAVQPQLDMPGDWIIRADAQKQDGSLLSSSTLEFEQKDGTTRERLAYVSEGQRNLVPAGRPSVLASSNLATYLPSALADGNPNTSWYCRMDDDEPAIDLKFHRARTSESLKLVLAPVRPEAEGVQPRIAQIEVRLNDSPAEVHTVSADLQSKMVLAFDEPRKVRRVRLRVLSLDHGQLGQEASVGLAEVELY
jgi:hypothetical protein